MTSEWRKSSRSSSTSNADCVEARATDGRFEVRDSKLGETSPILGLDSDEFTALLRTARR